MRRLATLLFGPVAAQFRSARGLEDARRQLSAATHPSVFDTLFRQAAVGRIGAQEVVLWRYTPWLANGYNPRFIGRFHVEPGSLVLSGRFEVPLLARIFMACGLGLVIVWTLVALLSALLSPGTPGILPVAAVAFLAVAMGFVMVTKRMRDNDIEWLSKLIEKALERATPAEPFGR